MRRNRHGEGGHACSSLLAVREGGNTAVRKSGVQEIARHGCRCRFFRFADVMGVLGYEPCAIVMFVPCSIILFLYL